MKIKHVVLIATAMGLAFAAARAADLAQKHFRARNLIAAIVPNYPPMELRETRPPTADRFDVELGEAMAKSWPQDGMAGNHFRPDAELGQNRPGGHHPVLNVGPWPAATRPRNFVDYLQSGAQFSPRRRGPRNSRPVNPYGGR